MWSSVDVVSGLADEEMSPEFKLTHHVITKKSVATSHDKVL